MESENLRKAIELRHELHMHSELVRKEVWTKNHLIDFIKENTELEVVDRGVWFYAYYHYKEGAEEYSDYSPEVYNHKENIEKIKRAAKNLGYYITETYVEISKELIRM